LPHAYWELKRHKSAALERGCFFMLKSDKIKDKGRDAEIREILRERILLLDGAMGTALQDLNLTADDFGGSELEGCNENLVLTRPDAIKKIHAAYFEAGADIAETDTFGAIRHVLDEYGLGGKTLEINEVAARLAKEEAGRFSTPERPRYVAGSLGPGTKTITVTGGITFDQVRKNYAEAARGLLKGGVDLFVLETQQDTLNIKASLFGIQDAFEDAARSVPVILSVSIETMGTMLGGQTAEALYHSISHFDLLAVGLNCATGPDFMTDHLRALAGLSRFPVVCYPNAGLPNEDGEYNETPEMVAEKLRRFQKNGWLNIAGGCCGTTPAHIKAISQALSALPPRALHTKPHAAVSGLESLDLDVDRRPVLVGERTNVIGSRVFKKIIIDGDLDKASEIGRRQVRGGAQILDVCLANPDRDEAQDMNAFLDLLTKKVKAPLMIDTTDAEVLEGALSRSPGKAIVNSINLEDGEERFEKIVPLLRRYGAAVVVGTIDEDKKAGMAVTRHRKLEIAKRSYDLLTTKYGMPPEDIVFDPLVFPCATGDANYFGSAEETIEGLRLIKKEMPRTKTILGISNVSFGLPVAGREVLNAVFMHHCVQAGLDLAIVNSEKLARFSTLPPEEKELADKLLFWKGPGDPKHPKDYDGIAEFAAHFRDRKASSGSSEDRSKMPVRERIARCVVEGSKEGLIEDLDILLAKEKLKPLQIINGPLMVGMDKVGVLFGNNDMIVAEVLQSAEVMKAAVAHLEPHMTKDDVQTKGKIVLATVKGDVHDIGKNLVHIILKNNGYEIIDLGIKVAPQDLIQVVKKEKPDAVGLSGLLVKSAQQMVITADELAAAGIKAPILVGGAALSAKFTAGRIAPKYPHPVLYAKDAMMGLDLANQLTDVQRVGALLDANTKRQAELAAAVSPNGRLKKEPGVSPVRSLRYDHNIPSPPDTKRHVLTDFDLDDIFKYINPVMLYGRHLGLKGNFEQLLEAGDKKAAALFDQIAALKEEILESKLLSPRAVVRFLPAYAEKNDVVLLDPSSKKELVRFGYPRQERGEKMCLSDFVLKKNDKRTDYVASFVVTAGPGVREKAEAWLKEGEYLKSHAVQALAMETAEAFAELLHERIRSMWGIPDAPDMTLKQKFQARYRGIRVSPGYPACPEITDQEKIWALLSPEETIGVKLTEGHMMDPEASVSAVVFHHPQAHYFAVGETSALA
jgi:5-methyltetrahydrofolate--homocysteine methyltransferase